eukprot:CAMPEP_0197657242 /NCGR_PEP_ID=MMETSP1338-20131121/44510_1 /TAXON_ID=43686 ORGANISM="Pelagodinium beii, Strain RCC1491" /NCGR_SAMPLE_ID=MMETSP1338 /ASSEMBLY_ACC=CAM_ASM_000754 /LENGTH=358 /DNA_ID=CAMNT_0043233571 /DNA_START=111 /DNA_END=1187 /DNA_ORIENTATION=+
MNLGGSGYFDDRSTEAAWVFPDGLEVGRQVQYFSKDHSESGSMKGWGSSHDLQTFAVGQVVNIEQPFKQCSAEVATTPVSSKITASLRSLLSHRFKACPSALRWTGAQGAKHVSESESEQYLVTCTWLGAAQKKDQQAWSQATVPMAVLRMEPSSTQTRHQSWCWDSLRRYGRAREIHYQKAQRVDDYQIQVPAEAWKLMPKQTFVVQLTSIEETAGRVRLQMSTIGGEEFNVQLPKDSVAGVLMQSVAEQCQLGPCCHVSILNDGELLEPLYELRSLESSKLREPPYSQSQHESAMPETMEISDAAKSGNGNGSDQNVDIKAHAKLQCAERCQKFDSKKADMHDPNRHQENEVLPFL